LPCGVVAVGLGVGLGHFLSLLPPGLCFPQAGLSSLAPAGEAASDGVNAIAAVASRPAATDQRVVRVRDVVMVCLT
jgi:hypothetical protein